MSLHYNWSLVNKSMVQRGRHPHTHSDWPNPVGQNGFRFRIPKRLNSSKVPWILRSEAFRQAKCALLSSEKPILQKAKHELLVYLTNSQKHWVYPLVPKHGLMIDFTFQLSVGLLIRPAFWGLRLKTELLPWCSVLHFSWNTWYTRHPKYDMWVVRWI